MTNKPRTFRAIALRACCAAVFIFLLVGCAPRSAQAQFLGYTSPQTVTSNFAVSCVGGAPTVLTSIQNLGQTSHVVSFASTPGAAKITLYGGNNTSPSIFNPISPIYTGTVGSVNANGYYSTLSVATACTVSSTITIEYLGTSSSAGILTGQADVTAYDYVLTAAEPAGTTKNFEIRPPPYASSGGTLYFIPTGTGSAGAQLYVSPQTHITSFTSSPAYTFVLATTGTQAFQIPPSNASEISIGYIVGGASAATYSLQYVFNKPGTFNASAGLAAHITGTTATPVKPLRGTVVSVSVNTPAAGTVSLFDLATAACTGTPSTNVVAVITPNATDPPNVLPINALFNNGICVKASVAMDLTVTYQ